MVIAMARIVVCPQFIGGRRAPRPWRWGLSSGDGVQRKPVKMSSIQQGWSPQERSGGGPGRGDSRGGACPHTGVTVARGSKRAASCKPRREAVRRGHASQHLDLGLPVLRTGGERTSAPGRPSGPHAGPSPGQVAAEGIAQPSSPRANRAFFMGQGPTMQERGRGDRRSSAWPREGDQRFSQSRGERRRQDALRTALPGSIRFGPTREGQWGARLLAVCRGAERLAAGVPSGRPEAPLRGGVGGRRPQRLRSPALPLGAHLLHVPVSPGRPASLGPSRARRQEDRVPER